MINDIKTTGSKMRVGNKDAKVQRMLYDKVIVPTLTYNLELVTHMSKAEYKEIEKLQGKALRQLYNVPSSTPYWGMLAELGVKPMEYVIHYKRLMVYHNILHSNESRIVRKIVADQKTYDMRKCLYEDVMKGAEKLKIDMSTVDIETIKKSQLKRLIKYKMQRLVEEDFKTTALKMSKLRFLIGKPFQQSNYTDKCEMKDVTELMMVRLNMIQVCDNYGQKVSCMMCNDDKPDTTEHLMVCTKLKEIIRWQPVWDIKSMNDIDERKTAKYIRKAMEIRTQNRRQQINSTCS